MDKLEGVIVLGVSLVATWIIFENKYYKQLVFRDEAKEPQKKRLYGINSIIVVAFTLILFGLFALALYLGTIILSGYFGFFFYICDLIIIGALFRLFLWKLADKNK